MTPVSRTRQAFTAATLGQAAATLRHARAALEQAAAALRHARAALEQAAVPLPHRRPTGGTRPGLQLRWS
jgi:multidrug efflux pump subunit AcrA (membrane-fusion protein)